jgi:tRNA(Ile)-lysidine synthase
MTEGPGRAERVTTSARVVVAIRAELDRQRPGIEAGVCVALSGGLDSTVMLHALARSGGVPVRAAHVNHQLHPEAGDWQRHCQRLCAALSVPLESLTVTVDASGEGVEAAARRARYRAIASVLRPDELLLTAHHMGDQAETVLLHLMRGSGVAGLAGIPRSSFVEGCRVVRPLLDLPRSELLAYAQEAGLAWIEDPANVDPRMDRNFLRREVIPLLAGRWPDAVATIARSGRHCADAAGLVRELARQDLRRVRSKGKVSIAALRLLSDARQRNLLRFLCLQETGSAPPAVRLREGLDQLLNAAADRHPVLAWPGGELRRYREALYLLPVAAGEVPATVPGVIPARPGATLELGGSLGRLRMVRARGQGLAIAKLAPEIAVRFRTGGERLRTTGTAHMRDLKNLFQEQGVVPWMRDSIPLLYSGEALVAVAGLWVAAEFAASGTEPGLRVRWDDHPALD